MTAIYDYNAQVLSDVKDFLEENEISLTSENLDEIYDTLFVEDSVTGNASGSYFCSAYEARKALFLNEDLFLEAIDGLGYDEDKGAAIYLSEPETADVIIRCYLLGPVLNTLLEEQE